jgi:hypothetical protein
MVKDEQVRLLRQKRMDKRLTEEAAAAAAGMSRPTFECRTPAGADGTHLVRARSIA